MILLLLRRLCQANKSLWQLQERQVRMEILVLVVMGELAMGQRQRLLERKIRIMSMEVKISLRRQRPVRKTRRVLVACLLSVSSCKQRGSLSDRKSITPIFTEPLLIEFVMIFFL